MNIISYTFNKIAYFESNIAIAYVPLDNMKICQLYCIVPRDFFLNWFVNSSVIDNICVNVTHNTNYHFK